MIPVSVKKHSSGGEDIGGKLPSKHRVRGWRGVSAAALLGKGWQKRIVSFTDTDMGMVFSAR